MLVVEQCICAYMFELRACNVCASWEGKGRAMYVCVVEPCVNECVGVRAMCKCVVIVHLSVVSRTRKV